MLLLASMAASGDVLLEGVDDQWIREPNLTNWIAFLVFVSLWKLHRFLGQTLLNRANMSPYVFSSYRPSRKKALLRNVETKSESDLSGQSTSSSTTDSRIPPEDDLWLQEQVPGATAAERLRFYVAANCQRESAAKALRSYQEWRVGLSLPEGELSQSFTGNVDEDHWNVAVAKAFRVHGIQYEQQRVPQFARTYETDVGKSLCDSQGARIVHMIPGFIDDRVCAQVVYATVLACYLDEKLHRESSEKITVILDVRGGEGWRNLHVTNQLPFVQHTCQLLLKMFPERLSRAVVFPIPSSFVWLWTIISRCMEKKTREKVAVLAGTATIKAPPPMDQMVAFMTEETAHRLEQERVAAFVS